MVKCCGEVVKEKNVGGRRRLERSRRCLSGFTFAFRFVGYC